LKADGGALFWNYTLLEVGSNVVSSPAVVDDIVYIGSAHGNVYALNATDGTRLWNNSIGNVVYSSPAVVNGVVYIGAQTIDLSATSTSNGIYALNATNGAKIWNYDIGSFVESSPAVVDGVVYTNSGYGGVYALGTSPSTSPSPIPTYPSVSPSPTIPELTSLLATAAVITATFMIAVSFRKKKFSG
jgi:eukaryotic-like serine/threonine-protein kinase